MKKIYSLLVFFVFSLAAIGGYLALRRPLVLPAKSASAVAFATKLSAMRPVTVVSETATTVTIRFKNLEVLFSKEKDVTVQVQTLQALVDNLRMDSDKMYRVDLRFNKAVISGL